MHICIAADAPASFGLFPNLPREVLWTSSRNRCLRLADRVRTGVIEQRNRCLYDLSGYVQSLHEQLDGLLGLRRRSDGLPRPTGFATAAEALKK